MYLKYVVDQMVYNQQILNFTPSVTDVMIPLLREQKETLQQKNDSVSKKKQKTLL